MVCPQLCFWPDFEQKRQEIVARPSAVAWADKLAAPLLLMHGAKDREAPVSHTLRLAAELAKAGKDFGVMVVHGANHTLFQSRQEPDRNAMEFFRRHLGG